MKKNIEILDIFIICNIYPFPSR